jgi:hypothetical protein
MAKQKRLLTSALVRQLFELANTPFRLHPFRERWESFGWSYQPEPGDEFSFRVHPSDRLSLLVQPLGDEVIDASLAFYYWENYDPEFHDDPRKFDRELKAFEREFEVAARLARRILPPPLQLWTDDDKDAHKAIIWKGGNGLLILQQACFDPQFGIEVDFWLTSCPPQEFRPTSPLIDFLCNYGQRLHATRKFPPLSWD